MKLRTPWVLWVASVWAGNAVASASVAVYGEIDTAIGRSYSGAADWEMLSGYTGDTKLGFRGSEEVGHGLKVNFQLEASKMDSDTGAWTGGFGRQAWVGLSGGWGEWRMGRTNTPQNRAMGQFDLNGSADGSSALKVLGLAANSSLVGSRESNQLHYASPLWHGLQVRAAYGFSETVKGEKGAKRDFMQLAANYQWHGLTLGAAFQPRRYATQAETAQGYRDGYVLGAKYRWDGVQASVLYGRNVKASEGAGWGAGLALPWGAWQWGAQVAWLNQATKSNGQRSDKQGAKAYELFSHYRWSKRTVLYGAYGRVNHKAETAFKLLHRQTFAVGLTHKF